MKYLTDIRDDTSSNAFSAEIEFTLLKTVNCKNSKLKNIYINKLNRLQKENFNRVKIPKFTYSVEDNIVFCIIDFIKGAYINTSKEQNIIYEDIVCHESDWTFADYHNANFIVEEGTETIYSVDFQSYRFHPNKDKRKKSWATYLQDS